MTSYVPNCKISYMSQTIVSDKISKRGKDIEEYLGSRYLEPWFSKTRRSEKMKSMKWLFVLIAFNF